TFQRSSTRFAKNNAASCLSREPPVPVSPPRSRPSLTASTPPAPTTSSLSKTPSSSSTATKKVSSISARLKWTPRLSPPPCAPLRRQRPRPRRRSHDRHRVHPRLHHQPRQDAPDSRRHCRWHQPVRHADLRSIAFRAVLPAAHHP